MKTQIIQSIIIQAFTLFHFHSTNFYQLNSFKLNCSYHALTPGGGAVVTSPLIPIMLIVSRLIKQKGTSIWNINFKLTMFVCQQSLVKTLWSLAEQEWPHMFHKCHHTGILTSQQYKPRTVNFFLLPNVNKVELA